MTTQPTHTVPLPVRPANGFRRPALVSALGLAEYLTSAQVPAPSAIDIQSPITPDGEAIVRVYHHHDMDALHAWQAAFGGEISHRLHGDAKVYSELSGRVYDAPFIAWTLRDLTKAQQAAERQMCARWYGEHGAVDDWSAETRALYADVVLRFRLAAAK